MELNKLKEVYGLEALGTPTIVNRETYSGRGRPKKSDYINIFEVQKLWNKAMSVVLDKKRLDLVANKHEKGVSK